MAPEGDDGGRVLKLRQQIGVGEQPQEKLLSARLFKGRHLALRVGLGCDARRLAADPAGKIGQSDERRLRSSDAGKELEIGYRPDALRAEKAGAVDLISVSHSTDYRKTRGRRVET